MFRLCTRTQPNSYCRPVAPHTQRQGWEYVSGWQLHIFTTYTSEFSIFRIFVLRMCQCVCVNFGSSSNFPCWMFFRSMQNVHQYSHRPGLYVWRGCTHKHYKWSFLWGKWKFIGKSSSFSAVFTAMYKVQHAMNKKEEFVCQNETEERSRLCACSRENYKIFLTLQLKSSISS